MPIGLILAMALAAILYMAVAITAVSVVPYQELAAAPGPITEVVNRAAPAIPPIVFTFITLFAVANTALVNYVTASRLIYGMARQGLLHERLGDVHPERRTPHIAVAALFIIVAPLALLGIDRGPCRGDGAAPARRVRGGERGAVPAQGTEEARQRGYFEVPRLVPALGVFVCLALIVVRVTTGDWRASAIAGGLLLGCLGIYALMRPKATSGRRSPPTRIPLPDPLYSFGELGALLGAGLVPDVLTTYICSL